MHRSVLLDELDLATAVTAELEYTTLLLPPLAVTGVLTFRSEQGQIDTFTTLRLASENLAAKIELTRIRASRLRERVNLYLALGGDFKGKISFAFYGTAVLMAFWQPWISSAIYIGAALMWLIPDRRLARVVEK